MKRNILENDINIFLCKNRTKVNDVIKYFKENNIIKKKKINIKLVKTELSHAHQALLTFQ